MARKAGWATCPVTQAGFVRVSSNSRAIPGAVSPRAAFEVLSRITALPGHRFYADDLDLSASDLVPEGIDPDNAVTILRAAP